MTRMDRHHLRRPSLFDGDGRAAVEPVVRTRVARPLKLRKDAARQIIKVFDERGWTQHSSAGGTLWVVEQHCFEQGIAHEVVRMSHGYHIRKT